MKSQGANTYYAEHINKSLSEILNKKLNDVYQGSTTITALKTGKQIISKQKTCPANTDKSSSGIAMPLFENGEIVGAFSLYVDTPNDYALSLSELSNGQRLLLQEIQNDLSTIASNQSKHNTILGQSPAFLNINERAAVVANTDIPVLIRGEHGVGKEVLARFIHENSSRKGKPFVTVNCAAIPETLIESELFGYSKGAFSGALANGKLGKFELANTGTLFLDEIGDMSPLMQTKLLRALQEKEIEKVGSEKAISVDVRIISATNRPLEQLMREEKFRADFYYRINAFTLNVPPLRERREDIILLLDYYLKYFNTHYKKHVQLTSNALESLKNYSWPGNVRELRNVVENIVVLSESEAFDGSGVESLLHNMCAPANTCENSSEEMMSSDNSNPDSILPLKNIMEETEKHALISAIKNSENRESAYKSLGISKKTFYRKLEKYAINPKQI